jgi:type VI secretion system protein ImpJ
MFLWPQQMQQAERYVAHQVHLSGSWDTHHCWGLRALDLDLEALANSRFVARSLQARLKDGTMVVVPDDTLLPALDFKEALERQSSVDVLLAVPALELGKANTFGVPAGDAPAVPAAAEEDQGHARYVLSSQNLEDENTGLDSQPIDVRYLNAQLLLSTQSQAGYTVLRIARLARAPTGEGPPVLDGDYIPPLLACDAWKPLQHGIMQATYDRYGGLIAKLAAQVVTRGISFDTRNAGDALVLAQLRELNEAYAYLQVMAFADGVHPLPAYVELCRLAGQLAIFDKANPRAPILPQYDHDDLGLCFHRVKRYLDSIKIEEPIYEERPFVWNEPRMEVQLEPKWLEPIWQMFVGVESSLKVEECVKLFTRAGQLDMKIASALRVDKVFGAGSAGLRFTHSSAPPRSLPSHPGLVYFQISRESQQAEWKDVHESKTLAIRLNRRRIEPGTAQGERVLNIKTNGHTTKMQFTLYLAPLTQD